MAAASFRAQSRSDQLAALEACIPRILSSISFNGYWFWWPKHIFCQLQEQLLAFLLTPATCLLNSEAIACV